MQMGSWANVLYSGIAFHRLGKFRIDLTAVGEGMRIDVYTMG
jgi:hypothetical protein